ncbi:MAG TPA: acyl carrier protein [Stellaceae bacterium]|nr:acyl carrier protein [Stellaceae bacterium]
MPEPEIYATLTTIFRDVFLRDDLVLTPELNARDVADWDSFKHIEIIIAVQEHYGIKFRTRELDSLNSVGDLVRLIASKT